MNILQKYFYLRKIKKENRIKLNILQKELIKLQEYLDHEGKIRGMCKYDENDMNFFWSIKKKLDNKEEEINKMMKDMIPKNIKLK